jgi:DNA-binding response OmpR family regulator
MSSSSDTQSPRRILLVEDEAHIARPLQFNLEQEGYQVMSTPSGREALEFIERELFDLIILDVMIEEMDGFEVARRVRGRNDRLPILVLTARAADQDRVQGLEIGVDDYMVKPFHLRELLLRVQRMLQRAEWYADRPQERHELAVGPYQVNLANLTGNGPRGTLHLTALEAGLLETLTGEPNRIFTRAELLEKVWGYHGEVETRTVDNFMLRLRRYFEEEPEQPRHFVSVRSRGYMYVP